MPSHCSAQHLTADRSGGYCRFLAGGLAADAAQRKRLPQSCMRGGARTSGRNLLHHEPLSHVRLPPASCCISDVRANSIHALALAAPAAATTTFENAPLTSLLPIACVDWPIARENPRLLHSLHTYRCFPCSQMPPPPLACLLACLSFTKRPWGQCQQHSSAQKHYSWI